MNSRSKKKKREVAEEVPEKSKGQLFKEQHGISKTLYRNMRKKGLNPFVDNSIQCSDQYKAIRKARKLEERKARQKKHAASVLHMRTKGKVRKSRKKKGSPAPVKGLKAAPATLAPTQTK